MSSQVSVLTFIVFFLVAISQPGAYFLKETRGIDCFALGQAYSWRIRAFVCLNTCFQKHLELAGRIPWQIQPLANAYPGGHPNGGCFDCAGF